MELGDWAAWSTLLTEEERGFLCTLVPLHLRLMISPLSQIPKREIWETSHLQVHTISFFPQSCGTRGWTHHPPLAWDPGLRLYQAWASMGSRGVTEEGLGVIPSSDNSLICWTDFSCKNLFCNKLPFRRNFSLCFFCDKHQSLPGHNPVSRRGTWSHVLTVAKEKGTFPMWNIRI